MGKEGAPGLPPRPEAGSAGLMGGIGARRRRGLWPREQPRWGGWLAGGGGGALKAAVLGGLLLAAAGVLGGRGRAWRRRQEQRVGPTLHQWRWARVEAEAGGRGLLCAGTYPLEAELRLALDAAPPPAAANSSGEAAPSPSPRAAWAGLEARIPPETELKRLRAGFPERLRRFGSSQGGDMVAGEPVAAWAVDFFRDELRELRLHLPAYPAEAFSGRGVVVVPRRAEASPAMGAGGPAGGGGRRRVRGDAEGHGAGTGGSGGDVDFAGPQGGGVQHWADAVLVFASLRRQGCALPGELWLTPGEMAELPEQASEVLRFLGAEIHELPEEVSLGRGGAASAVASLVLSGFEEALLLDTDSVPVGDPTSLFSDPGFRATGSLFWEGSWAPSPAPELFSVTGERDFMEFSHEGGQYLVNKRRAWRPLLLAGHMSLLGPGLYSHLLADLEGGGGVKEALPFGFQLEQLPRSVVPHAPETVGATHLLGGRVAEQAYGHVFRRPDGGRLLFLRQGALKTSLFNLPDEPRGKSDDGSSRPSKYASHQKELREAAGLDVEAYVWTVLRAIRCDAGVSAAAAAAAAAAARARARARACPPPAAERLYMLGSTSPDLLACAA